MSADKGTQPLSGVKVLDFTQVMMGPCCTQMLADYGADVIKIERPGAGDLSRTSLVDDPDGLNNPVFRSLNRNKRSIALDLRGEAGKAVVYDLVKTAVAQRRPGHPGAGPDRRDGAQARPKPADLGLCHGAHRLLGRHAPRAGYPAR